MCDSMVISVSTLRNRRGRCAGAIVRAICGGRTELSSWSEQHPQAADKVTHALAWHGHNGPLSTAPVLLNRVTDWGDAVTLMRTLQRIDGVKLDVWPDALLAGHRN